MSDNKKIIEQNIDIAIDPAGGIGSILAANHNAVLKETLRGAGKYIGIYYQASGDLSGNAPTGTFLWNGNDPSNTGNFVIRFAKFSTDLNDVGDVLNLMAVGGVIRIKDESGRSFVLFFQGFAPGVDGLANPIYDVTVQGSADNLNYIYGPAEIETSGFDMYSAGGGGGGGTVVSVNSGQGITVDNADPINPIIDLGGTIDEFVQIDINESVAATEALVINTLDQTGNIQGEFALIPAGQFTWNIEDTATGGGSGFSNFDFGIFGGAGAVQIGAKQDDGLTEFRQQIDFNNDITNAITITAEDDLTNDRTRLILKHDELRIVTPNVDGGSAVVGEIPRLENLTGEIEYTDDYVTRTTDQTNITGEKTFGGNFVTVSNRLSVVNPAFGPSRLGDSDLQTPSLDVQSINWKDTGQVTGQAMFITKVAGAGVDGYVTTMKNFVDDVNVISVAGLANETFGGAARQVESTLGLRNDFTGGEFRVFDTFNNDYDAATDVAEAQGWVAIHGGGATKKKIGLWRYDGVSYDQMWGIDGAGDVMTLNKQTDVQGILRAFTGIRIQNGGVSNSIQMQDAGGSSYTGLSRNIIFWDSEKFSLQPLSIDNVSAQFDLSGLSAVRQITVPDSDITLGTDANAIHVNVAGEIAAITEKVTPVAADLIVIEDSAAGNAKKRVQIGNLPGGGGGVSQSTGNFLATLVDSGGGATFTITPPNNRCEWIRIGDMVLISIRLNGITQAGVLSGLLSITNLPFSLAPNTAAIFHGHANDRAAIPAGILISDQFQGFRGAGGSVNQIDAYLPNSAEVIFGANVPSPFQGTNNGFINLNGVYQTDDP